MRTLVELLNQSKDRWGTLPAVTLHGEPSWSWTYTELWDAARRTATYLRQQGVGRGDRVVIWSANRPEWVAAFFGLHLLGAVAVPLDVRSREELLVRIEQQAEPRHLLLGRDQAEGLTQPHPPHTLLEDLRDAIAAVEPLEVDLDIVGPHDIAELMYTSGTTGQPKGVILTHRNIVSNVEASYSAVYPTPQLKPLSILPLSHMYEQTGGLLVPLSGGASVTYVGSLRPDVIFAAMAASRSTAMCCVPHVLRLFRQGIEREVRRQGKARLFNGLHAVAARTPFARRRHLFRTIHQKMGGHFEFFLSGGAFLDPELGEWWARMGVKVLQGYGMTEAAPIVSTNTLAEWDVRSVGRPLPGVQVRFADDHEILVRGENVSPGYWQDEDATQAAFADGWYHTGDLGYQSDNGHLHLYGRKKNVIVLPDGMNVYPEDVENVLVTQPGVRDAVVLGVPRGDDIEIHAVLLLEPGADGASPILKGANVHLAPHQRVRGSTVWPDENFPLTPTLKVKRNDVASRLAALPDPASRETVR